ncbi:MAG TPA: carboxypeptidase [Clostridiales bacterium]|nr:carboxypeptidase [Clostridiales bacterium]
MESRLILSHLQARLPAILEDLRELVERESPSLDKPAVDRLVDYLGGRLSDLGARVELIRSRDYGHHLRVRWGPPGPVQGLLLCHTDTVWPVGEVNRRPFRVSDGWAWGPGTHDMKGGIAQLLAAMGAMRDLGIGPALPLVAIFNSEEEVGSPESRELIEEEGRRSRYCLVLEPPTGDGHLKTFRKGVGGFRLRVTGKPAHAGADHAQGVSAIQELAHQVLRLHSLTDYAAGLTVNVGVVRGGTRSNVVAETAEAEVDFRVPSLTLADAILQRMKAIGPTSPGLQVSLEGGLNRPPMERTPAIVALYRQAADLAAEMGFAVGEGGTGGASDGNFVAALGTPVLDGLGAMGSGGHALDERVLVEQLPWRAALLVRILQTFN